MGRDDEFSDFVAARWARLVRTAVLVGCSAQEAEDLVQSTLERCLRKWAQVRRADDVDAYVHRMLLNGFRSSRRRHWTRERPTAEVPALPSTDLLDDVDSTDAVMRALERLTPDQRAAVVLRYYAHLSEAQMATVLDVAAGTVKSRLSRALRTLADDPHLRELRGTQ